MSAFKLNLEQLSYRELLDLSDEIQSAIKSAKARETVAVRAEAQRLAEMHGMTLQDLISRPRRSIIRSEAKYVNPHNPKETWSGRGRRPHWYTPELPATTKGHRASATA
jgi:DNA-binding protein H-NS